MRGLRYMLILAVALLMAACSDEASPPRAASQPPTERKPLRSPALRRLESQASRLLDGDSAAFRRRLAQLRGYPVVVNQWASWCTPCRVEFPFFQRLATKYRERVAFLGVDAQDNRDDAAEFLKQFPTPFPHFYDKDAAVARVFYGGTSWPTTAFYNASGKRSKTHWGAYATQAKLERDVREFALDG